MIWATLLALGSAFADAPDGADLAPVQAEAPPYATPDAIDGWLDSVVVLLIGPAWCSGVVLDDQGTIATAYHCMASGGRAKVTTRDGKSGIAHTISAWPSEDLAIIQAPELAASLLHALPVRAEAPRVGARVYGLGHPYAPLARRSPEMEGMLLWSVSEGIVSNTGPHLIQTDTSLNPGNSGGPLVDSQGGIVGIVSRKLGGDNLAFAASSVKLTQLLAAPRPLRWWGGEIFLGGSVYGGLSGDAALSGQVRGGLIVRDHAVLTLGVGVPLDARKLAEQLGRSWYPSAEASLAARQRIGRGTWSTTVEVGPTLLAAQSYTAVLDSAGAVSYITAAPMAMRGGISGRVGVGGVGLRAEAVLEEGEVVWLFGFDADVPGVISTF